jgi:hypothetical protein
MNSFIMPKFKQGDFVLIHDNISKTHPDLTFSEYMDQFIHVPLRIADSWLNSSGTEIYYRLNTNRPVSWAESWLRPAEECEKPMFKEGDRIMLKEEIDSPDVAYKLSNSYFDIRMMAWKGIIMKLERMLPIGYTGRWCYLVNENTVYWCEEWLEKVEVDEKIFESMKPKFSVGDWVILKEEIEYIGDAYRISDHIKFSKHMLGLKNRFMKIREVRKMAWLESEGAIISFFYRVNENEHHWHEKWLDKVE